MIYDRIPLQARNDNNQNMKLSSFPQIHDNGELYIYVYCMLYGISFNYIFQFN